jgi:hypothetical protein
MKILKTQLVTCIYMNEKWFLLAIFSGEMLLLLNQITTR